MKKFGILLIIILFFGCVQEKPESPETVYLDYTDEQFSFKYPDWSDAEGHTNKDTVLVKTNVTCVFGASKYAMPSIMLKDHLEDYFNTEFNGEYAEYTLNAEGTKLDTKTRVVYCDYTSYALTLSCVDELADSSVLSETICKKRTLDIKPKLGLIPSPSHSNVSTIYPAIKQSRKDGVDVFYWFFSWGDLENNWTLTNYLLEPMTHEGRTAVTVEVLHSNVLGKYPDKYKSFDDPGFKEDFAEFSVEFVKRYNPDYFFVGNEVDEYLWTHREQIPAFKEVLAHTRERIKQESPNTKVGFTTTYHDALRNDALDIAQTLSEEADIIGYTSHGYHDRFVYDNVSIGVQYLNDLEKVVPGKPFAVVETGWSSSPMLNSSEELQAEFVQEYFNYLETTDAEFAIMFTLHDGDDCTESAESFLVDHPEVKKDEEFMAVFKEYICKLGLKKNDGTPKKAWRVWKENSG